MSMKTPTTDLVIIGGGAAGLMAACRAAEKGLHATVLEPNAKPGRKLRITGKGRCNLTNNCPPQEFLRNVLSGDKFVRSAIYRFSPQDAMDYFESLGVPLKTERGERVFPVSDRADDVADALECRARSLGVRFRRERALEILTENGAVSAVRTTESVLETPRALICTGGLSYPATGSTGDGYALAEALGHRITPCSASLVPLEAGPDCDKLQGLSLRNVTLSLWRGDRLLYRELGEMLFTHFGVSGPLVLSASAEVRGAGPYRMTVDLKPGLTAEKLDERLLRDFAENKNRCFKNSLDALLPQKLISVVIGRSGIDGETRVNSVTRAQRLALGELLKAFPLEVYGKRGVEEAIVTSGGVDTAEVNPRTMESRLVPGLFFAGEVLDMDAYTGGFNLQLAWSTAVCAVNAMEKENME